VIGEFEPMLFAEKVLSGLVAHEARQHDLSSALGQTDKVRAIVRVGGVAVVRGMREVANQHQDASERAIVASKRWRV
jgi:hypothetical protein